MFPKVLDPFHGYINETITLLKYLASPRNQPNRKFVIFGVPRSGSTLLVDLLNSHPIVQCDDELLLHKMRSPEKYIRRRTALSRFEVYGFKLLSDHFDIQEIREPDRFLSDLYADGFMIISLIRQDLFRSALSSLYVNHIGKTHHKASDGELTHEKMVVKPDEMKEKVERFKRLIDLHEKALGSLPRLDLSYEDDLLNEKCHQATVDKISDYLGFPRSVVTTQLVKVTGQDVSDFVSNSAELNELMKVGNEST
jgi:hypothetical protein